VFPQPALAHEEPALPALPQAQPAGFTMPSLPAEPGLVMPSAPTFDSATTRAEPAARHAEPAAAVAPAAPSAPPPPAPVGYTASADPAVANRYRMALHNPEPEAEPDPFGAAVMGPSPTAGLAAAGGPNQPGWQGMALPGAGAPGVVPPPYVPASAVADATNKTAWTALGSGALAIGLAVFFLFFDRIGLWPALLAFAAIVQGIVAAVRSRKAGSGLGPAIAAIVLGAAALVIMVTTVVSWTLNPEYYMPGHSMEVEIVASGEQLGLDLVSATCPDELSGVAGDTMSCTAAGADGTTYDVEITVDSEGYFNWTVVDPAAPADLT